MTDLISRADAIEAVRFDTFNTLNADEREIVINRIPSAEAEPKMTEEVREALMRLTMCAREECGMCKYKDECGFDFQYKISTDNMNTLADALLRSRCEVDAKSAEAVQGEWIYCEDDVALCVDGYKCFKCGFFVLWDYDHTSPYFIEDYHFCPKCGTRMTPYKGGDE